MLFIVLFVYAFVFVKFNFMNFNECQSMTMGSGKHVIVSIAKAHKIQGEMQAGLYKAMPIIYGHKCKSSSFH